MKNNIPEKKAKELYNRYWDLLYSDHNVSDRAAIRRTKRCVLIAINTAISTQDSWIKAINSQLNLNMDISLFPYLDEVKNEVEKL